MGGIYASHACKEWVDDTLKESVKFSMFLLLEGVLQVLLQTSVIRSFPKGVVPQVWLSVTFSVVKALYDSCKAMSEMARRIRMWFSLREGGSVSKLVLAVLIFISSLACEALLFVWVGSLIAF